MISAQIPHSRSPEGEPALTVMLLGPLTVRCRGQLIEIASRKARALLAILACRLDEPVSRETLRGMLWGDRPEVQARASLRQALSELRTAFGAADTSALVTGPEFVSLSASTTWVDLTQLQHLATSAGRGGLDEAASLIRGELLEGFATQEAAFEQWLTTERERVRALCCSLLERLALHHEKQGQLEDALAAAHRVILLDPLRENVHRTIMRLLASQGRAEAALAQYERCSRLLFDDLKVRPNAETEELARSIRTSRRSPGQPKPELARREALGPMSIAVVSFANQTGERGNDVLCEAIADEITGALSKIAELFVLSRRASLGLQGASTGITQIGQELGVRYVLGGSIRIAGERLRVATELTDAQSGAQVWADRFDGELTDVFGIQDEIARRVALALQIKLTHGETIRFWEGQTRNLRAWEKMVEAREHFGRYNKIDNAVARRLLREAIEIDPNYTGAIALHGMTHWWDARFNPDLQRDHSLLLADEQIARLRELDPELGSGYMLRGAIAFLRDQHDDAIACAERAALLAPSDFHVVAFLGVIRLYNGQHTKAIATLRTAMRINPNFKPWVTYNYGLASLARGDAPTGLSAAREYMEREPEDRYAYAILAIALTANNNASEAQDVVSSMRDRVEELTIQEFRASHRFRDRELLERLTDWLSAAGLH